MTYLYQPYKNKSDNTWFVWSPKGSEVRYTLCDPETDQYHSARSVESILKTFRLLVVL